MSKYIINYSQYWKNLTWFGSIQFIDFLIKWASYKVLQKINLEKITLKIW